MKTKILMFFLCVSVVFPPVFAIMKEALPGYETVIERESEPLVYITSHGEKYHNRSCHYLKSSRIAIGKKKAISKGYKACSYCLGNSSGVILEEYERKEYIDNTGESVLVAACTTLAVSGVICVFGKREKHVVKRNDKKDSP